MGGPSNASNIVPYERPNFGGQGLIQAFSRDPNIFVALDQKNGLIHVYDGGGNPLSDHSSLDMNADMGMYQSFGIEFRLTEYADNTAQILASKDAFLNIESGHFFVSASVAFGGSLTISATDDNRFFHTFGADVAPGLAISAGFTNNGTAADYLSGLSAQAIFGVGYGQSLTGSGQSAYYIGTPSLGAGWGSETLPTFLELQRQVEASVNWLRALSDPVPVFGWGADYNPLGLTFTDGSADGVNPQDTFWSTFAQGARDGWTSVVNADTETLISAPVP